MKQLKIWIITFFIIIFLGLGAVAGLVIFVDPFFQYHKPLNGFPYIVDQQVNMNPGLAKNMDYDIIRQNMTHIKENWKKLARKYLAKLISSN